MPVGRSSQARRCRPWRDSTEWTVEAGIPNTGPSRRGPSLRLVRSWQTRCSTSTGVMRGIRRATLARSARPAMRRTPAAAAVSAAIRCQGARAVPVHVAFWLRPPRGHVFGTLTAGVDRGTAAPGAARWVVCSGGAFRPPVQARSTTGTRCPRRREYPSAARLRRRGAMGAWVCSAHARAGSRRGGH